MMFSLFQSTVGSSLIQWLLCEGVRERGGGTPVCSAPLYSERFTVHSAHLLTVHKKTLYSGGQLADRLLLLH